MGGKWLRRIKGSRDRGIEGRDHGITGSEDKGSRYHGITGSSGGITLSRDHGIKCRDRGIEGRDHAITGSRDQVEGSWDRRKGSRYHGIEGSSV